MRHWWNKQRGDRGTTSVILLLLIVPVVFVAVGAIDYSRMNNKRLQLQNLLDAAALGAVGEYNNPGGPGQNFSNAQRELNVERRAQSIFESALRQQQANLYGASAQDLVKEHLCINPAGDDNKFNLTTLKNATGHKCSNGTVRVLKLKFSYEPKMNIVALKGDGPVTLTSMAALDIKPVEINVLFDNTLSMGLPARGKKIERLGLQYHNVRTCFYACHQIVGLPLLRDSDPAQLPNLYGMADNNPNSSNYPSTTNPYYRTRFDNDGGDSLIECTNNGTDFSMTALGQQFYGCKKSNIPSPDETNGFLYTVRSHQDVLNNANARGTILNGSPETWGSFNNPNNKVIGIQFFEKPGDLARALTVKDSSNSGRIILDDAVEYINQYIVEGYLKPYVSDYTLRLYTFDSTPDGTLSTVQELSPEKVRRVINGDDTLDLIETGTNLNSVFGYFSREIMQKRVKKDTKRVAVFLSDGVHDRGAPAANDMPFSSAGVTLASRNVNPNRPDSCAVFNDINIPLNTIRIDNNAWHNYTQIRYRVMRQTVNYLECDPAQLPSLNGNNVNAANQCGKASSWRGHINSGSDVYGDPAYGNTFNSGNFPGHTRNIMETCAQRGGGNFLDANPDTLDDAIRDLQTILREMSSARLIK